MTLLTVLCWLHDWTVSSDGEYARLCMRSADSCLVVACIDAFVSIEFIIVRRMVACSAI